MEQFYYRAALYLRLSRDDYGSGDSSSIQTQQMMLERYCKEQNLHIHDTYIDDGFSGLNFDRPSFKRLLGDIKNGFVNLVITKDLSRLGRDYIQTGYYTELFFPQHRVRYIALNDGVDTLHDNNDIAPFKNILNDMYARDLSRKVKLAKRARAERGAFIGSHPPYGYKQSPASCNVLEINKDTAPTVQRIFNLALGGIGAVSIAKLLRQEKILTPAAYKVQQGDSRFAHLYENSSDDKEYRWAFTTVQRILRDKVYLGHMVAHKSEVEHYKTKKRSAIPKNQQIVVEGTHLALISQEDFDKVQQLIAARHSPNQNREENIFRALIYCGECGRRLSMAAKVCGGRKIRYYRCMHHYHFPNECRSTHFLRFDHINRIVHEDFGRIAELLTERMNSLIEALGQDDTDTRKKLNSSIAKLKSRAKTVETIIKQLYEDFAAGRTSIQNYNRLLDEYQSEQSQIESELQSLCIENNDDLDMVGQYKRLREIVERHLDIKELDARLLNELVDKIHVGQRQKMNGIWEQDIRIIYRFACNVW